jgi:NAD(P)H-nitrite reductase large subunit
LAIENRDPFSGAEVLARGLVGDLDGQLVVASPVYKQHFNLRNGRCLEDESVALQTYPCGILDGRVWIEMRMSTSVATTRRRRRLVVVGNGMAALRTLEELLQTAPETYDITVFGAEPRGNYNRILLSPLLAGQLPAEEIMLHPPQWYAERGIALRLNDQILTIDRRQRRVMSAGGVVADYDRLLLATGSEPVRLKIPGQALPGIFYFRSWDDVENMLAQAKSAKQAVVIGGGLLGLEAASGLQQQGLAVTVIHLRHWVMDKQLDEEAAALLQQSLQSRGIEFRLAAETASFEGTDRVESVRLSTDEALAAQLVVIATGTKPRMELARNAGLVCDRGILVDDTMQTFDPSIYAVGECVQHRGATFGLVAPVWEQARVCAAHLAEHGVTRFRGSSPQSHLKVSGIDVFSAGDIQGLQASKPMRWRDPASGIYQRLWIEGNRLKAAVLFGDTRRAAWFAKLIEQGSDVSSIRQELLLQ